MVNVNTPGKWKSLAKLKFDKLNKMDNDKDNWGPSHVPANAPSLHPTAIAIDVVLEFVMDLCVQICVKFIAQYPRLTISYMQVQRITQDIVTKLQVSNQSFWAVQITDLGKTWLPKTEETAPTTEKLVNDIIGNPNKEFCAPSCFTGNINVDEVPWDQRHWLMKANKECLQLLR